MNNKLAKIIIGQNVEIIKLGGKGTNGRFDRFRINYNENNRKAGTYIYEDDSLIGLVTGGKWSFYE
jgi:hypothetical protein